MTELLPGLIDLLMNTLPILIMMFIISAIVFLFEGVGTFHNIPRVAIMLVALRDWIMEKVGK